MVPILYDLLNDNTYEYDLVSAHTLRNYKGVQTKEVLIKALQSHNWYVRKNAAESLVIITKIDNIKKIMDKLDDKYAKEALSYQLYLREKEV